MKIGILTFSWALNYGAVLQMYAEYKYLSRKGEVFVINYVPDYLANMYNQRIFSRPLTFKAVMGRTLRKVFRNKLRKKFREFIVNNMVLTEELKDSQQLAQKAKDFDLVIVGSDQVWNHEITKDYLKDYLLLGVECNKASYAASLGRNEISAEVLELFQRALAEFKFVSVREIESIGYLKKICEREDYKFCVDPVFLLDKSEWESLAQLSDYNIPYNEFVLVYMLEYNEKLLEVSRRLGERYKIPVTIIALPFLWYKRLKVIKKFRDVGVLDFVKLFMRAKFVVTNSFHGTAFSLIFQKPFIPFAHTRRNLRLKNMLRLYNLEDVQVTSNETLTDLTEQKIEGILLRTAQAHETPNRELVRVIEESKRYLDHAVEEVKR